MTISTREVLLQLEAPRLTHVDLGDLRVRITHPDRVLWPASSEHPPVTRRDLLKYLVAMSEPLLHYMKDRPLTLLRYPTGLNGRHFFQKHVEFEAPAFVDR